MRRRSREYPAPAWWYVGRQGSERHRHLGSRLPVDKVWSVTTLSQLLGNHHPLRWAWDDRKSLANRRKHGLGFETARLVFDDPLAASRQDLHGDEERWKTIGMIGSIVVIVAHTWPGADSETDEEIGRIISARKATAHERRLYEEGDF